MAAAFLPRRGGAGHLVACPSDRQQLIVNWFISTYTEIGFAGCSSHSGRRTFITRSARVLARSGGSLRDIQELVGHRDLGTTQRYIEGDRDAQRKLITLI